MKKFKDKALYEWIGEQVNKHVEAGADSCLIWPFSTQGNGYGQVRLADRTMVSVHRYAFFLAHGHYPTPQVRHSCDTPRCFNPKHLIESTQGENNADMVAKGRASGGRLAGEDSPVAVANDEMVRALRREYVPYQFGVRELSEKYGIGQNTVFNIVKHKTWKHVK